MADVIKSVRQYLLTKSGVTDLVGQRIYQGRLKQTATVPAIVLSITSENYDHDLGGLSGLTYTRIQVECYADTAETSRGVADAVIWSGIDAIKGTYTSLSIRGVTVEDGRREYEDEDTSGGDSQRHITSFDLMVSSARTS